MVNWCYLLKFYFWSMGPLISLIHITSYSHLYIYSSLPVSLVMFLKWNILHHMFPLSPAIIHWTHYIYSNVMRALPSPFLSIWYMTIYFKLFCIKNGDGGSWVELLALSVIRIKPILQPRGEGGEKGNPPTPGWGWCWSWWCPVNISSGKIKIFPRARCRLEENQRGLKCKNVNKGSMDITS